MEKDWNKLVYSQLDVLLRRVGNGPISIRIVNQPSGQSIIQLEGAQ